MQISKVHILYFSATYTTRKIVRLLGKELASEVVEYDMIKNPVLEEVILSENDLLLVGMPVYAGRIPPLAVSAVNQFKGNRSPAVITCVYGNREYDDALLELKDLVVENGFKVVSAAAFIAQHAIFPKVGMSRPDDEDNKEIILFAQKTKDLLNSIDSVATLPEIAVPGNRPYKMPGSIPIYPSGNKKCDECGTCVHLCPTHAIPEDNPRKTIKDKCITCGRCIVVCPQDSRHFGGLIYKAAKSKFEKAYAQQRKEAEMIFAQ